MANLEITTPLSIPVVLTPDGAGNCLLQSVQGKGRPCIQLGEVWAYVYDDPADKTANPHADAVQILPLDLAGPPPGSPYCGMVDTNWKVRLIGKARNGPNNFLRVWAKFVGDANYTPADATFTGTACGVFGGPPPALAMARGAGGAAPAPAPYAIPPAIAWSFGILPATTLDFPLNFSQLTGLIAFPTQSLELDLASPDEDPIWTAGDPHAGPHWLLRLSDDSSARLRLRLNIGGPHVLQQFWDCASFDQTGGGIFEPFGSNVMMHRIEVTLP